eukprot:1138206-Pelagomonas_calceolata.AAC.3
MGHERTHQSAQTRENPQGETDTMQGFYTGSGLQQVKASAIWETLTSLYIFSHSLTNSKQAGGVKARMVQAAMVVSVSGPLFEGTLSTYNLAMDERGKFKD